MGVGRMHLVCYLRQESKVFETYWTTSRGVEYMDNSYRLLDLTVYGRQERFEDSPAGWPRHCATSRALILRMPHHIPVLFLILEHRYRRKYWRGPRLPRDLSTSQLKGTPLPSWEVSLS